MDRETNIYFTITRNKTMIFMDAKPETTVQGLKELIMGITQQAPDDMRLIQLTNGKVLEDQKTLGDYGFTPEKALVYDPVDLGLVYRKDGGFEELFIAELSPIPELPDVMKSKTEASQ